MRNEFAEPGRLPDVACGFAPEVGLVLGSGLGDFVDRVEVEGAVDYGAIEGVPVSRVAGHAGRFVLGKLGALPVVIAQGRVHLYEGWPAAAVTAGVRVLAAMGVKRLILTNAAGVLNEDFAVGGWMQIADHLNLTGASPLSGGANFVDLSEAYSRRMRERFAAVAEGRGMRLYEGVYASVPGPQYETPAEVRMLRALGADAVGMSTVLEAIQARALRLEVAGFSCLTNWGAGLGQGKGLSHAEVVEAGRKAAGELAELLEEGAA